MPEDPEGQVNELNQQAGRLIAEGRYDEGQAVASQARELARQHLGDEHPLYAVALTFLARLCSVRRDRASAEALYRQALGIFRKTLGEDDQVVADMLHNLAALANDRGDHAAAESFLQQAVAIYRRSLGEKHPRVAACLLYLATAIRDRGDLASAEPVFREALEIQEQVLGADHLQFAESLYQLAGLYFMQGNHGAAEPLLQQALAIRRRALGEAHPDVAACLHGLAELHYARKEYAAAEPLYREALEVARRILGDTHPDVARYSHRLSNICQAKGDHASAETLYAQALAIYRKTADEYCAKEDYAAAEPLLRQVLTMLRPLGNHPLVANHLSELAHVYREKGDYAAAEPLAREALALARRLFGPEHPHYADRLQALAIVCRGLHNYTEAEALYRQALELRRGPNGDQDAGVAGCLASLGELYVVMGRHAAAEVVLGEAAELVRQCNPGSGEHALVLNNLGQLYLETGRPAEAAVLLDEACQVGRRAFEEGGPHFASILNNLAHACLRCGRHAEAEPLYEQSLRALRAATGGGHPNYAATLHALARLYAGTGRADRALPLMQEAEAIQDQLLARLTSAPEAQRQAHLRGELLTGGWWWVLSLAALPVAPAAAIDLALDVTLRRKAVGLEAAATQREALMSGRYPALAPKLRELTDLRFREAGEVLAGAGPSGPAARRQRLGQLRAERDRLEAELARSVPELTVDRKLQAADRQAVAAALPAGSALVEFVLWRPYHFEAVASLDLDRWGPARYAAFVLAAGEPDCPRLIDLGDAAPVDRLVASFRAATDDAGRAGRNLTRDEPPPATSGSSPGATLRAAVFDPLRPALSGRTRLLLAPDGDLSRLAFEALPLPEGGHLIDAYRVSYLGAGRDVLRFGAPRAGPPGAAVVIADPDFDLTAAPTRPPGATGAGWAPTPHEPPAAPACRGLRGLAIRFARLPGTRAEGEQVGALLGVRPWLGGEAVKGRLKECQSPRVLHLATHGFFLGEDQELEARRDALGWEGGAPAGSLVLQRGTMLRSGLALGGANTWLRGGVVPAGAEEGLLTAAEACELDLGSTELVVLSACDTGLGEGQGSEGIFGLRRAFQLSGAGTLVMSLWKVNDLATAFLMGRFYDNLLARGLDRDLALSEAQRSTRAVTVGQLRAGWLNAPTIDRLAAGDVEARRALAELARQPDDHRPFELPFYWAAFICQGDTTPLPAVDKGSG
jgi:tetratricopeptide (TPR) repeat protein